MKVLPAVLVVALTAAMVVIPSRAQPPKSLTASPPQRPAIGLLAQPVESVRLDYPPRFQPPPLPVPELTLEQDRRRQLWMADLAVHGNAEAQKLIPMVDLLLNHPANEAYRPKTSDEMKALVRDAHRAMQYQNDDYQSPPFSTQLIDLFWENAPKNPLEAVKEKVPKSVQKGFDLAKDKLVKKYKLDERLAKAFPTVAKWVKAAPFVGLADQAFGELYAYHQFNTKGMPALYQLNAAVRRAAPATLDALKRPADPNQVYDAAGRLIAQASRPGTLAAGLAADGTRFGLNVFPDKKEEELRNDKRYKPVFDAEAAFRQKTGGPVSADNPFRPMSEGPPTAGELTVRDQRSLTEFAREMRRHRQALDRNTAELKVVRAKLATTAEQLRQINDRLAKLTEERSTLIQDFAQGAELALQCLAHMGVDPKLVRDLTVVTRAGVQVAQGIAMLAVAGANVWNPVGWLTILSGITSLFSTGPDPMQLVLEQLAAIRRDLADFRYEMRLSLAELRQEVRVGFDKVLTRLNDMEFYLTSQLQEVKGQGEWNEYRLNRVEGQISALGQQILTRFAELQQRDVVTLLASRDLYPKAFAALSTDAKPSELLEARYHDALAVAYASAVHHAANWSLARGDTDVPGAYGTVTPTLGEGSPRLLLSAVHDPAAPWANVNDFMRLARTVDPDLLPAAGAGDSGQRKLAIDRSRVVNPLAWSVAAGAYLDLAVDGRKYFTDRKELVRGLVEVYRRGEEFNDAAHRVGTAEKGGVFAQLTSTQLKAIDELEKLLLVKGEAVIKKLGGQNPWAGIKQDLPDGRYVHWDGTVNSWVKGLKDGMFDTSGAENGKLDFPQAELEALIQKGVVPKPFAAASLVRPAEGRGGDQSVFGGTVRLTITGIDVPLDDTSGHVKHRWSRRESTGLFGTGPGKYHGNLLYEGPVYVTIEGHYQTSRQSGDYLIFRQRVPSRSIVRFQREERDGGPRYWAFTSAAGFNTYLDVLAGRRPAFLPPEQVARKRRESGLGFVDYSNPLTTYDDDPIGPASALLPDLIEAHSGRKDGFQPLATVAADWSAVREELAKRPTDWLNPGPGATPAAAVERMVAQRFEFEVLDSKQGNAKAVFAGLTDVSDQIREVMGCQGLLLRYVQLALPEYQSDPELLALLNGDQAAWGGTAVVEMFQLGKKEQKPFVIELKDKDGKTTGYETPVAAIMRAQTLKLQAKLAELIGRKRADATPYRHPAVEGMLLRIAFTARSLGVDLKSELADAGVPVPDHWTCHQLNQFAPFLPPEKR